MFSKQYITPNLLILNKVMPNKNSKDFLIKNFFKKKRKKSINLSNFFLYNLYNMNCWYIDANLFVMPVSQTRASWMKNIYHHKNELITKYYCAKYKTSQDFFFAYLTLSNTYRNFFCNLSYKINSIKNFSEKRKYFLQNNFIYPLYSQNKLTLISNIEKNNNNSIKIIKEKTFLNLWFANQSYLIFLFLFVCLLKSNTLKLKKLGISPRQGASVHTSGGLIAKTQTRGLVFLKKNSPSFLYKYFQNVLNSLTKTITGETSSTNFSHVHLTILLKNFDKRYNFILKRLLKKFRKQVCGNFFYRKNIKFLQNSTLINTFLKNKQTNKIMSATPWISTPIIASFLYKTMVLRLFTFQHIRKNFLRKKFFSIYERNITKSQQKNMQVVLNYQFFDLTKLPHNGTKTKTKPRK